jgi:hypothetical protein
MLKLIFLIFIAITQIQAFVYETYPLYRDSRFMRMGGANVGLGGSGTSVFSNPAGLSKMRVEDGAEVKLINLSVSTNSDAIELIQDGLDVQDIDDENEQTLAAIDVIDKHLGENNHFEVSNFSYIAKKLKNKNINFSIGALTSLNLDFVAHRGFATNGVIDIQGLIVGGIVAGMSYVYTNKIAFGGGIKYLKYGSMQENFTIGKLLEHKNDLDTYLQDEALKDGYSLVFDLGTMYKLKNGIQVGFSALNLGGIGEKNHITYIPETYNLGLGYIKKYKKKFLKEIRAGIDYVDLTNEYNRDDKMENLRGGLELLIWNNTLTTFSTSVGFYKGEYTAGFSARLAVVEIGFTTYAEEVGHYLGQQTDRRYLVNITIGW